MCQCLQYMNIGTEQVFRDHFNVNSAYKTSPECQIFPCLGKYSFMISVTCSLITSILKIIQACFNKMD